MLVPPTVDASNQPKVAWPSNCEVQGETAVSSLDFTTHRGLLKCGSGLERRPISVKYALFNPSLATFFRMVPLDGVVRTAVLPPKQSQWQVPATPSRWEVARDYALLGVEHIWKGVDHLLFVTGLLILAGTGRRIVWAITGFSVSHSISLSLSALGFVHIPVPPTEAAIALSILFLACEIVRGRHNSLAWRYPLLVSTTFGLLHGLGFAAALGEIGLPVVEIPTALLFFSAGVEAGQLAFVLPIIAAMLAISRLRTAGTLPAGLDSAASFTGRAVPWGIGILASFWFVERAGAFVP
jgi:hydrogenase/urease accessory protein HupE